MNQIKVMKSQDEQIIIISQMWILRKDEPVPKPELRYAIAV